MENNRSSIPWKGKNKFLIERKLIYLMEWKLIALFHLMQWKHLENREKYVIYKYTTSNHICFFNENEEMSHQLTMWQKKFVEEIQKQKLDWENWNNYQRNGERHVYFSWTRAFVALILLFYFTDLFGKKTQCIHVCGNY